MTTRPRCSQSSSLVLGTKGTPRTHTLTSQSQSSRGKCFPKTCGEKAQDTGGRNQQLRKDRGAWRQGRSGTVGANGHLPGGGPRGANGSAAAPLRTSQGRGKLPAWWSHCGPGSSPMQPCLPGPLPPGKAHPRRLSGDGRRCGSEFRWVQEGKGKEMLGPGIRGR